MLPRSNDVRAVCYSSIKHVRTTFFQRNEMREWITVSYRTRSCHSVRQQASDEGQNHIY